tara:strand:- start:67038 stop:67316 length:279 start_codon:yes stop_codon:yes gene_type:complete
MIPIHVTVGEIINNQVIVECYIDGGLLYKITFTTYKGDQGMPYMVNMAFTNAVRTWFFKNWGREWGAKGLIFRKLFYPVQNLTRRASNAPQR